MSDGPETEPAIFRLVARAYTAWCDYGDILQHGMTSHVLRHQGLLQLWRTGPFAPPLTFPGFELVVDNDTRRAIEGAEIPSFRSIGFRPVLKAKIVRSDWPDWDLKAEEPREYPGTGEPEDYLFSAEHDPELAQSMPEFLEVVLAPGAWEDRRRLKEEGIRIFRGSWNGCDWFKGDTTLHSYVTEVAREWIEPQYGKWVDFEAVSYSDR